MTPGFPVPYKNRLQIMKMSQKKSNASLCPGEARAAFPGVRSLPGSEKPEKGSESSTASRPDRLSSATSPTLGEDEQSPCTSSSMGRRKQNTAKAQEDPRSDPSSTPSELPTLPSRLCQLCWSETSRAAGPCGDIPRRGSSHGCS